MTFNTSQGKTLDLRGVFVPKELGIVEIAGAFASILMKNAEFEGGLAVTANTNSLDLSGGTVRKSLALELNCQGDLSMVRARVCNVEIREKARIAGDLDASHARFFGTTTIGAIIGKAARFDESRFAGPIVVAKGQLGTSASFRNAHLRRSLHITSAFTSIDLSNAVLNREMTIAGERRRGHGVICFNGTVGQREIRLNGHLRTLEFDGSSRLRGGLSGQVDIERAVEIHGTHGSIEMEGSSFSKDLLVEGDVGRIRLNKSMFGGALRLSKLRCAKDVSFRESLFRGDIVFEDAQVNGTLDMTAPGEGGELPGKVLLRKVVLGNARFDGRVFEDATDLSGCLFLGAPSFRDCEFHTETVLPRTLRSFPDTKGPSSAKRYQVLQRLCRDMGWRLEEGMFFALEQRSLRHSKLDPSSDRWLSWLYDAFSNYGTNVARALTVFVVGIASFTLVFAVVDPKTSICACPIDWPALERAFLRSLGAAFVPFYELRDPAQSSGIAIFESFLSIPTIAMILVALRWRFRKGE